MQRNYFQSLLGIVVALVMLSVIPSPLFAQFSPIYSSPAKDYLGGDDFIQTFSSQHHDYSAPTPDPMPAGGWMSKPVGGRNYWGFELGLTYNWLQGAQNFALAISGVSTAAGDPIATQLLNFSSAGSGIGFLVGGVVDFAMSDKLAFVAKLRYMDNSTSSTDTRNETNAQGQTAQVTSQYTQSEQYADLEALLRFQLSPNSLYLIGGFGFSDLLSNGINLSQTIDNAAATGLSYNDVAGTPTGQTSISQSGSQTSSVFNTTRVAFKFGVGTFIPIGSGGTVLTPEVVADIPFTSLYSASTINSVAGSTTTLPNLWHIDFSLGLKFPWGASSDQYTPPPTEPAANNPNPDQNADDMVNLKGTVHDKNTGKPVDANMTVIDLSDNKVVATGHTDDGNYSLPVKGPGKYSVTADADGYVFGTTYFEVDNQGRILRGNHDIAISPASAGRTRLLIFFDFGKDNLQPASYPELDRAVHLMKAIPTMEVEIAGYTDNIGSDAANNALSLRRANTVRSYLVNHGISGSRITAKGYGESDPIATNDTDEGRAENRRVEFVIEKK